MYWAHLLEHKKVTPRYPRVWTTTFSGLFLVISGLLDCEFSELDTGENSEQISFQGRGSSNLWWICHWVISRTEPQSPSCLCMHLTQWWGQALQLPHCSLHIPQGNSMPSGPPNSVPILFLLILSELYHIGWHAFSIDSSLPLNLFLLIHHKTQNHFVWAASFFWRTGRQEKGREGKFCWAKLASSEPLRIWTEPGIVTWFL